MLDLHSNAVLESTRKYIGLATVLLQEENPGWSTKDLSLSDFITILEDVYGPPQ